MTKRAWSVFWSIIIIRVLHVFGTVDGVDAIFLQLHNMTIQRLIMYFVVHCVVAVGSHQLYSLPPLRHTMY